MAPMARTVPVGRLGTGDDVGATAAFLASNEAAWLTSQTINLNGGATMN
jgi:NAD(P)-dependent dehydrogenase (short-subunit alcohol dehydrogenase family)